MTSAHSAVFYFVNLNEIEEKANKADYQERCFHAILRLTIYHHLKAMEFYLYALWKCK